MSDHHLDTALTDLQLSWFGTGRESVTISYPEDAELLNPVSENSSLAELFVDPRARYGFFQLADRQSSGLTEFNERWWHGVWTGELIADSLTPLRQGLARSFELNTGQNRSVANRQIRSIGTRTNRRLARSIGQGWGGNWSLRVPHNEDADPLTKLEDEKERVRLMLDRYGFICRELANREGAN